ncbi:hypothetical protein Peur_018348 [Populus x canadensis]
MLKPSMRIRSIQEVSSWISLIADEPRKLIHAVIDSSIKANNDACHRHCYHIIEESKYKTNCERTKGDTFVQGCYIIWRGGNRPECSIEQHQPRCSVKNCQSMQASQKWPQKWLVL